MNYPFDPDKAAKAAAEYSARIAEVAQRARAKAMHEAQRALDEKRMQNSNRCKHSLIKESCSICRGK